MMHNVYTKQYTTQNDFFWKRLCVVDNNESLGLIERMLQQLQFEYKIEEQVVPKWCNTNSERVKLSEGSVPEYSNVDPALLKAINQTREPKDVR